MAFRDRLIAERQSESLTQKELAELIGVSQNTVWAWEQEDGRFPKPNQIKALADVLEVTPKWLETGLGEKTEEEAQKKAEEHQAKIRDNSATVYNREDEEKLRDIETVIKFIKQMDIPKERKRRIHRTMSGYRAELESIVLFGEKNY